MWHLDEHDAQVLADQAQKITRRKRVYNRIKDRGLEAEDVWAQAVRVFLSAVQNGNYKPAEHSPSTQEAYLTGIVEKVINDMGKRRATRQKHEKSSSFIEDVAIDQRLREEEVDPLAMEQAVEQLISEVTDPTDRRILMEYLKTPRLKRIAETMGLEPATVRQRFNRLRRKLLKKYGSLQGLLG